MTAFLAIGAMTAILGAFDLLVAKFGAESRPGFDERTKIR